MEQLTLINVLPITNELWLDHSLFSIYTSIYHQSLTLTHNEGKDRGIYITWAQKNCADILDEWRRVLRVDERTFKKILDVKPDKLVEQGYTVLMPVYVWAKLEKSLSTKNIGRRQSITRVYCYLYYYSMRFQGSYSHSRGDMMRELKMNNNVLAESIAWLEENKFIIRSDYSMRENERYSRRYYIPNDDWSAQCKKEWIDTQRSIKL